MGFSLNDKTDDIQILSDNGKRRREDDLTTLYIEFKYNL
jgi:hypothetical protein